MVKKFEDPIYKHLGEIEVQDQIKGVEFLRTLDYVDAERIGIYGHSYWWLYGTHDDV